MNMANWLGFCSYFQLTISPIRPNFSVDGPRSIPRRGIKSRLLQFGSSYGYDHYQYSTLIH